LLGLAIVPLYGILQGKPTVKDLDLNQSLALSLTGLVWTSYGFLVVPRYDPLEASLNVVSWLADV
jgi:hypothetical protein